MADYTDRDLEALQPAWLEMFGETMPMGFEVTPDQVPLIQACLDQRSQEPLNAYIKTLDDLDF